MAMNLEEGSPRRDRENSLHKRGRPTHTRRDAQHHRPVLRDRNHGGIQKPQHHRSAWKHDTRTYNRPKHQFGRPVGSRFVPVPSTLHISNLDYGTSESDIYQLLIRIGYPKSITVHRDRCGLSLGTAVVIFERTADAEEAVKRCNGVRLNGQLIGIQFTPDELMPKPRVQSVVCIPSTTFSQRRKYDESSSRNRSPTGNYRRRDNSISSRQRSSTRSYNSTRYRSPPRKKYRVDSGSSQNSR